jgi:NADPH:quinone reductase-like Zn-dependent oxidoreductase
MRTVRAVVQDKYGQPEVLEVQDVAKPAPSGGEVLLRVHAAGVDPSVWHLMTGLPFLVRPFVGLRRPRTRVRGMDVAGRVELVGADVTRFRSGDEVFGTCEGSFAEYACARADRLAPKPNTLTFEQAAAIPVSACTALQALRDQGRLRSGQHVLVIGAGGGVGTFAVQLAKAFGATVTGVCSTAKVDLVRSIGADEVIDYTRDQFPDETRRYDLILDIAGQRPLAQLRRALTGQGTLVFVGGEGGGRWLGGMDRSLRAVLMSPFRGQRMRMFIATAPAEDLQLLTEFVEAGKVTPVIDRTYPLSEAAEAVRYLAAGRPRGKIVLTV